MNTIYRTDKYDKSCENLCMEITMATQELLSISR